MPLFHHIFPGNYSESRNSVQCQQVYFLPLLNLALETLCEVHCVTNQGRALAIKIGQGTRSLSLNSFSQSLLASAQEVFMRGQAAKLSAKISETKTTERAAPASHMNVMVGTGHLRVGGAMNSIFTKQEATQTVLLMGMSWTSHFNLKAMLAIMPGRSDTGVNVLYTKSTTDNC